MHYLVPDLQNVVLFFNFFSRAPEDLHRLERFRRKVLCAKNLGEGPLAHFRDARVGFLHGVP